MVKSYLQVDGWDGISERKYLMQSGANRLKYFADQIIFKKIELINYSNLELLLSYPKFHNRVLTAIRSLEFFGTSIRDYQALTTIENKSCFLLLSVLLRQTI